MPIAALGPTLSHRRDRAVPGSISDPGPRPLGLVAPAASVTGDDEASEAGAPTNRKEPQMDRYVTTLGTGIDLTVYATDIRDVVEQLARTQEPDDLRGAMVFFDDTAP